MIFETDGMYLILAQDGPPAPTDPSALTGQPAVTGGPGGTAAKQAPPTNSLFFIFILMILGFLAFSIFGQRRDKKKRQSMLSAVKKHDRVQTIGGVLGSVVEVKPDTVVLKVDESSNTRITFSRSSIQQVLSSGRAEDTPVEP